MKFASISTWSGRPQFGPRVFASDVDETMGRSPVVRQRRRARGETLQAIDPGPSLRNSGRQQGSLVRSEDSLPCVWLYVGQVNDVPNVNDLEQRLRAAVSTSAPYPPERIAMPGYNSALATGR
jgi:hypothetical protein